ncbi:MAG TPA: hypothetical protein VLL97_00160 [Acidobacteriota bacterium]|nr:hypothetical protein [Acidobacteriota bacterium]
MEEQVNLAEKAAVGWIGLFVVMFANGTARVLLLQPWLGEDLARQVASVTGVVLVLLASRLFVRASPEAKRAQLLWVGVGWLGATVAFEFLFGHFVSGLNWSSLLADYNILRGRLWLLVLVSVSVGPWLWGVVLGRSR